MRILTLIFISITLIGCGMEYYPEDQKAVRPLKGQTADNTQDFEKILEKMIAMCTGNPGPSIGDQHNGTNQTPVNSSGYRIGPGSQSAPQIPDGAYESKMQRDQWGGGGAGGHIMNTIRDHSSYSGPWADKDLGSMLQVLELC